MNVFINGSTKKLEEPGLSLTDRSYLFGDGVYEVVHIYNGKMFMYDEHMERLDRSLKAVHYSLDIEQVKQQVETFFQQERPLEASLYLQVSRHAGVRSHWTKDPMDYNIAMWFKPIDMEAIRLKQKNGFPVVTDRDVRWKFRFIKSVSLLANCLSLRKALLQNCNEAILIEDTGEVTEGTSSNVFIVKDNQLITTHEGEHILSGITRKHVIDLAKKDGIEVVERFFSKSELMDADEVFVTNTISEIVPVIKIDDAPIHRGTPGSMTQHLQQMFKDSIS